MDLLNPIIATLLSAAVVGMMSTGTAFRRTGGGWLNKDQIGIFRLKKSPESMIGGNGVTDQGNSEECDGWEWMGVLFKLGINGIVYRRSDCSSPPPFLQAAVPVDVIPTPAKIIKYLHDNPQLGGIRPMVFVFFKSTLEIRTWMAGKLFEIARTKNRIEVQQRISILSFAPLSRSASTRACLKLTLALPSLTAVARPEFSCS
ncbi:hypothetical protein BDK51DRAFT_49033 [Blyttiomyces helicus]|uniref:Uncharacterized protein n=1 Tax=Blyttiomyces helicus TaxID=388810 RepID=A0A4P9W1J0_9FUNG|nr:hypothetical protein BDK51DRAFT_49033 [Blyttiomyces helicus]|eukprot:RKO86049.1 hypothetical protein BDK51DRAFT_49033 [Blyttiomyces helicus]